jgi:nucleotide-binding universal stress UspA family protein
MYKKILVPLDGSERAECALEQVKMIATGCGMPEVDLIWVAEPPPAPFLLVPYSRIFREMEQRRARMNDYLHKAARLLKEEGVTSTRTVIVEGEAATQIINYAEGNGFDLIIISSHGHTGAASWAFGHVAERVATYSNVPVIVTVPKGCRLTPEEERLARQAHTHSVV